MSGRRSASPESDIETLPYWNRGVVSIPAMPVLLRELRQLERRVHRGGKDSVDHRRGGHDDCANVLAGCLYLAAQESMGANSGGWGTYACYPLGVGMSAQGAWNTPSKRGELAFTLEPSEGEPHRSCSVMGLH